MINSSNFRKIILLVLLIFIIFGSGILLVDFVASIFGVYFPLPGLNYLKQMTTLKRLKMAENPYLLEREELYKEKEKIALLQDEIDVKRREVEEMAKETQSKLDELKKREKELEEKEKMLEFMQKRQKSIKDNIKEQATKIINMPPKDSVKILEKQSDEDVVDILREVDVYFAEIGRSSISPYLLKLMADINAEKAANVLRKLKYSADGKDTGVEVLEKNDSIPMP